MKGVASDWQHRFITGCTSCVEEEKDEYEANCSAKNNGIANDVNNVSNPIVICFKPEFS